MIRWNADPTSLTQLNSRYPAEMADAARAYARGHRLSMKVLLAAALAEYLAKRADPKVGPAPQLHYRRGRPTAELIAFQARLMHVDHRGRKIRAPGHFREEDAGRAPSRMALHASDGPRIGPASEHARPLRPVSPRSPRVSPPDGEALSLAR